MCTASSIKVHNRTHNTIDQRLFMWGRSWKDAISFAWCVPHHVYCLKYVSMEAGVSEVYSGMEIERCQKTRLLSLTALLLEEEDTCHMWKGIHA